MHSAGQNIYRNISDALRRLRSDHEYFSLYPNTSQWIGEIRKNRKGGERAKCEGANYRPGEKKVFLLYYCLPKPQVRRRVCGRSQRGGSVALPLLLDIALTIFTWKVWVVSEHWFPLQYACGIPSTRGSGGQMFALDNSTLLVRELVYDGLGPDVVKEPFLGPIACHRLPVCSSWRPNQQNVGGWRLLSLQRPNLGRLGPLCHRLWDQNGEFGAITVHFGALGLFWPCGVGKVKIPS